MTPHRVTTQSPYKLQMWPAHLLAGAVCIAAMVTIAHPSATRQFTWPWAPLVLLVWLSPLAAVLGRLAFRNGWIWPNRLLGTGLALLAGAILLSASLSPFAAHSILRIWPTLGGVALFFWLHDWLAESFVHAQTRSRLLSRGLAGFGAFLAIVSVLGWYWNNGGISWSARNDFPFGHSIYTAGAMLLVLPWLVRAALKAQGVEQAGWIAATIAGLVALFATSSRGGVLAAGAVCAGTAGLVLLRATWSRRIKAMVVILAAGVLVIAVWSNPRLRDLARGHGWSDSARESNVQRSAMLDAGAKMGFARPLLGWGPGTVPLVYPLMRHELSGGVDSVLQLHSSPAQLWATLGSGGTVALVLLLTALARRGRQLARQPVVSSVTLAAAASLLGYGLFCLTDHQLDLPAMNALLVVNLAFIFAGERPAQALAVTRAAKWRFSLAVIIILGVPLFFSGRDLLARFAYDQSLTLFEDERADDALEYLDLAAQRAPYDPYYRHQLAGRLLAQRSQANDNAVRAKLTARAAAQLEQSLAAGCFQEFAHFNLGWLALETGEPAKAERHFLAALREAPHRGGVYFGLGLALRENGKDRAAVRAFALEWINDPMARTAPLWDWPDFIPLRARIADDADALIAELAPHNPTARYVLELWHWWERGTPPPATGFNEETNSFARFLADYAQDPAANPPAASTPYFWSGLIKAWRQPREQNAFLPLTRSDAPFAAALAHRAERHAPPDLHGFLTAGLENEPYFMVNTTYARSGYGVLALHPDGPVLTNVYVQQQNRVIATFASTLFPAKGWLPAPELLTRLPPPPATP